MNTAPFSGRITRKFKINLYLVARHVNRTLVNRAMTLVVWIG